MRYEGCIRSVMRYGGETRALTVRLTSILLSYERKMVRFTINW